MNRFRSALCILLLVLCLGASAGAVNFSKFTAIQLGSAACGSETVLLGAGAKSGGEYALRVSTSYDSNAVDFRCSSAGNTAARWAHAGAFYIKQIGAAGSASALRGYAYSEKTDGANTGEISGVYGIAVLHGGTGGSISATGKLIGLRSRITIPTVPSSITTGNYYGLLIETDIQSTVASATDSAYIKIDDPNGRGKWLKNLLEITNGDVGTAATNMMQSDLGNVATVAGLKVKINGTVYWIQLAEEGS